MHRADSDLSWFASFDCMNHGPSGQIVGMPSLAHVGRAARERPARKRYFSEIARSGKPRRPVLRAIVGRCCFLHRIVTFCLPLAACTTHKIM